MDPQQTPTPLTGRAIAVTLALALAAALGYIVLFGLVSGRGGHGPQAVHSSASRSV